MGLQEAPVFPVAVLPCAKVRLFGYGANFFQHRGQKGKKRWFLGI
jgi:hypothetical protein